MFVPRLRGANTPEKHPNAPHDRGARVRQAHARMPEPSGTHAHVPTAPVLLVTGKGGVGRSTAATALALALAGRGERVALVHPADAPPTPLPSHAGPAPDVHAVDRERVFESALAHQLPRPLAAVLRANRAFRLLAAATPGLSELLTLAELRRLVDRYNRVVFDAPATGHLLALLEAPRRFERAAVAGPVATRARQVGDWIADPAVSALVAITTADSLAVSELLDLLEALTERYGRGPSLVVANRLAPPPPPAAELEALTGLAAAQTTQLAASAGGSVGPAAVAALTQLAARARSERAQVARITRALGVPPLRCPERPGAAVEALADAFTTAGASR